MEKRDLKALYQTFLEHPQPPKKLEAALEGFFTDEDLARRAAYAAYLKRRIRPAAEALIALDDGERLERLGEEGWIDCGMLDSFLKTAREQGKPEAQVCLLRMKQARFGYRDRDLSL